MQYSIYSVLRVLLWACCFINSQALVFPFPVPFPDTADIVDEGPVVLHFTAMDKTRPELLERIRKSNEEYKKIESLLTPLGFTLCTGAVFYGERPFSMYCGIYLSDSVLFLLRR